MHCELLLPTNTSTSDGVYILLLLVVQHCNNADCVLATSSTRQDTHVATHTYRCWGHLQAVHALLECAAVSSFTTVPQLVLDTAGKPQHRTAAFTPFTDETCFLHNKRSRTIRNSLTVLLQQVAAFVWGVDCLQKHAVKS